MAADVTADISPSEPRADQSCTIPDKSIKAAGTWDFPYGRTNVGRDVNPKSIVQSSPNTVRVRDGNSKGAIVTKSEGISYLFP